MRNPKLSLSDWNEIYCALELKACEIEQGKYDDFPGEATQIASETFGWAAHLRRIMEKIEFR